MRRLSALAASLVTASVLAACTTASVPTRPEPQPGGGASVIPPAGPGLSPATLPGWAEENHLAAVEAWAETCHAAQDAAYAAACQAARVLPSGQAEAARRFLEAWFVVERGDEQGLLTAYFAPEYAARLYRTEEFSAPVLARPLDLVADGATVQQRLADGRLVPYPARAEIDETDAAPIAWMRPEDLFFLQIQGSGYLTFEDGTTRRAAYAAHNGQTFVGIARPMVERGLLPANGTSGEAIRGWLARHRGAEAQTIMNLNSRYVFFRLEPDDGRGPMGAAGLPLVAGRSIAVDPAHWSYGDLVWIVAPQGDLVGADRGYQGLVVALDTGGAIRGPVRADFYVGRGEAAGLQAGRVRHPLRMWRLVPRS